MSNKKVTKAILVTMAKALNIKKISGMKKEELIHAIQIAEGNTDCFGRIENCSVTPCLFRKECQG
ncbi:MAG: Rho termination factor N-terminal domain-containing protein [Mariprofundales bacterium]|nr:Rho termination factor N-terminal domain-containing protein [Mariprofundales bacterium]